MNRSLALATSGILALGLLSFAPPAQATTQTYTFSNAQNKQTWTVPAGVTSMAVLVEGGAGTGADAKTVGNGDSSGGAGSSISVTRSVVSGEQFQIQINGAYAPNSSYCNNTPTSPGKGGYFAAIWKAGSPTTDAVVGGGGGGGGCQGGTSLNSKTPGNGGAAGLPSASGTVADGSAGSVGSSGTTGGGGTSSAGGAGGTGACGTSNSGVGPGTYDAAGYGGSVCNSGSPGGSGGGGFYGGGGGGSQGFSDSPSGGGGGSSKVDSGWTFASSSANSSTVAQVVITYSLASTDANLSGLVVSDGSLSPSFSSGTTSYAVSVPFATSSVTLTPTTSDGQASVTVAGSSVTSGSASGAQALSVGANAIAVVVTAEDGTTTKTYTVTVTRTAPSTDANLSGLVVSDGSLSPSFSSGSTSYAVSVPFATSSVTLTPTVSDPGAAVTVAGASVTSGSASGALALSVGANAIAVVVTAEDGTTTKSYTVTFTRDPGAGSGAGDAPSTPVSLDYIPPGVDLLPGQTRFLVRTVVVSPDMTEFPGGSGLAFTTSLFRVDLAALGLNGGIVPLANGPTFQFVPGAKIDISGGGYLPESTVQIYMASTPTKVGEAKVNDKGDFKTTVTTPATMELGEHIIQVNGELAGGGVATASIAAQAVSAEEEAEGDNSSTAESEHGYEAESASPERPLHPDDVTVKSNPRTGEIDIAGPKSHLPLQVIAIADPTGSLAPKNPGPDYSEPETWESLGYGQECWIADLGTDSVPTEARPKGSKGGAWSTSAVLQESADGLTWTPYLSPAPGSSLPSTGKTIICANNLEASAPPKPSDGKVTLCHATSSKTNPYTVITVDMAAVVSGGHGDHTGPVFPQAKWGDIIPSFPGFAGLNWPAGQPILDAGCSTTEQPPIVGAPAVPLAPEVEAMEESVHVTVRPGSGGGVPTHFTVTAQPGDRTCRVDTPARSCVVEGLDQGVEYRFAVTAANGAGQSVAGPVSDGVAPSGRKSDSENDRPHTEESPEPPAGVDVEVGKSDVTVDVSRGGGGKPDSTTITSEPGGQSCTFEPPLTSCTIRDLEDGIEYTVTAESRNEAGESDAALAPTTSVAVGIPAPPAEVKVVPGNETVTVYAKPGGGGSTSTLEVSIEGTQDGCTIPDSSGSCVVTGLPNGKPVSASVVAVNQAGSSAPSAASPVVPSDRIRTEYAPMPPRIPSAPTLSVGPGGGPTQWTAPGVGAAALTRAEAVAGSDQAAVLLSDGRQTVVVPIEVVAIDQARNAGLESVTPRRFELAVGFDPLSARLGRKQYRSLARAATGDFQSFEVRGFVQPTSIYDNDRFLSRARVRSLLVPLRAWFPEATVVTAPEGRLLVPICERYENRCSVVRGSGD